MSESDAPPPNSLLTERAEALLRALRRLRQRLERKFVAIGKDMAEAEEGGEQRRAGEALLTYLHQVPKRAASVSLPDPADATRTLEVALDPALTPQANAARYFKRAAKLERALEELPLRLGAAQAEIDQAAAFITRIEAALIAEAASDAPPTRRYTRLLDEAYDHLPPVLKREVPDGRAVAPSADAEAPEGPLVHAPSKRREPVVPARLQPRRLKTAEGWDVLIGRSNEGNDYVTHSLARPEDYWFHVHGCPGSHVVLRRGKGKNEPSKQTVEEVAAWAAFYSQARTAGRVPVTWTLKKYVRRPRKAPPGLAMCEREKSLMVRPVEPPRSALADHADNTTED